MEYIEKVLKKNGWSSLIVSLVFAILGIVLIAKPDGTTKVISYILGVLFAIEGIVKIINYLMNKEKYNFYNYDIAYGVVAIILGIVTIVFSSQLGAIFRILIGIWIVYSSVIRLNLSFKLKNLSSNIWIYSLVLAIAMFICGIYTIFTKNALVVTVGYIVLIYSILDIIESLIFIGNINKMSKIIK